MHNSKQAQTVASNMQTYVGWLIIIVIGLILIGIYVHTQGVGVFTFNKIPKTPIG